MLRRTGALAVSLVAESGGAVVGPAAASPVTLGDGTPGWFGLGPVSVAPAWQRRGVGMRLVDGVLQRLRERPGAAGCVVLGDPAYYGRFGFRAGTGLVLPGVPGAFFQALAFGAAGVPSATVVYPDAFDAAGG